jgi:hypothetical protein
MSPPRPRTPDELQEERHQQNLRKFQQIDLAVEANTKLTQQALTESQSNRHQLKSLLQTLEGILHIIEEDKKDRKEERAAFESLRIRELQKLEDARKEELKVTKLALDDQADEIKKLTLRFTWGMGFLTALSLVFHELGDLLAPVVRHLLH